MTADEAENLLTEKIKTYALTLETKNNGQEGITAKEMGLSYKGEGSVQALLQNQEKGRWFLSFSEKKEYQASGAVVYNEEMVRMGLSYKGEGSVQALLQNQEKGRWFLSFSEKKEYQASGAVVYNEEMVRMAIEGLFCVQNAQEPVDAIPGFRGSSL